ncbi:MAG: AsmA-like C-terminal region-containing protein [Candidatus Acidiferrales bacterium]
MPQTLFEPVAKIEAFDSTPRRRAWTRWPKSILLFVVSLWLIDIGISFLIRNTRLQRKVTARLESVFGRSVEVGRYDFSLWGGPILRAESVTFGEDARFGYEYFLRAESLTVHLRWQSLFRGHIELGTISLVKPSLNLVRNAEGDWNVAEWLPKPNVPGGSGGTGRAAIRFGRIEVDSGRINFKRVSEKLPFALVNVNGYLEPDGQGRWTMNLQAVPTRAAVIVQQAGTIYVSGHVGGTSSRFRPAVLDLAWGDASLSDVLRLVRGYDFGIRGNFAIVAHASTEGDDWHLQTHTEFRQLHRWDLALRPDNPALNLNAKMILYPLASGLEISEATIEAPHSFANASAHFSWVSTADLLQPHRELSSSPGPFEISQSQIDLGDVLAWIRAFQPNVAVDASLHGYASVRSSFSANLLRLASATGVIDNAELAGTPMRVPARLSHAQFRYERGQFFLSPTAISYGPAEGSLHLEATPSSRQDDLPVYHLYGNLTQIRDLVATAGVMGWNISRGWDLSGPLRCDLRWQGAKFPWQTQPTGTIEWGGESTGATLLTPFLNQPVRQIRAHVDLKTGSRHIALSSADAFGTRWSGTFDRRDADSGWQFALSAGNLSGSNLDRWLNPRWRESFLDRMLPFLNSHSPVNAVPENLRAIGQLRVDQFTLAPVVVRHLQGDLKIGGRHIQLSKANAEFYGGSLDGSLDAMLGAVPSYRAHVDYSHVDLAAVSSSSSSLVDLFAGSAAGSLAMIFHGSDRADLISSLECRGDARVSGMQLHNFNLLDSLKQRELIAGVSSFDQASAGFACRDGKIAAQNLVLIGRDQEIDGSGSIDFARNLDLRLRVVSAPAATSQDDAGTEPPTADKGTYALTGSLGSPIIKVIEPLGQP